MTEYPIDRVTIDPDDRTIAYIGELVLDRVHSIRVCTGRPCIMHNPSRHHMSHWKLWFREDKGLMERICSHGIGHPDPDSMAFFDEIGVTGMSVHGCDGCCQRPLGPRYSSPTGKF